MVRDVNAGVKKRLEKERARARKKTEKLTKKSNALGRTKRSINKAGVRLVNALEGADTGFKVKSQTRSKSQKRSFKKAKDKNVKGFVRAQKGSGLNF